nr:Tribbles homolog 3 (Drosophila) [Mus musculus]
MRATPLAASADVSCRKKPLEFDDNIDAKCPVLKRVRDEPEPGPLPSLLPPSPPPASDLSPAVAPATRLGPYILLEREQGSCSYRALHCPTGTEYTCKVYPASEAQAVLAPYARLPTHQHVARPTEVLLGSRLLYIFFTKTHGDLHSLVRSRRGIPEPEAAGLFRQMASAVAHCHKHGLVLRDLKLRRFVFSNCERTKLVLENLEDACVMTGSDDSLWDKHACPAYVGPEILSSRPSYSEPVLLFGKIRRGTFALPEGLSAPARCLIRCLLRKEPSERLVALGILLHPWLREDHGRVSPPQSDRREMDQVVPDGPQLEEAEEGEVGLYG